MPIPKKIKVTRSPKRGIYDKESIYKILDNDFLCHVGFNHNNYPVVIPTLYGRKKDYVYIHGSSASRMMKNLEVGIDVCITVTQVDAIVLARSAYHHSMNYSSVVLFGKATKVEGDEKLKALKIISDNIVKGRWEDCRAPNALEMKATMVLKIKIDEASAKVRTGPPGDEKEDYELNYWAGLLPIEKSFGTPINDPLLDKNIAIPKYLVK